MSKHTTNDQSPMHNIFKSTIIHEAFNFYHIQLITDSRKQSIPVKFPTGVKFCSHVRGDTGRKGTFSEVRIVYIGE